MQKQFLIVSEADNSIFGTATAPDPDAGPLNVPAAMPPDGYVLVPYVGEFSRANSRATEEAFWRDGEIVWVDSLALPDAKNAALTEVDALGEVMRMAVINRMTTQTEEYRRVESQARAWRAAGYPEGEDDVVPRGVIGWAMAKWRNGWTNRQACDDILDTADMWYEIIDTIRDIRLANKEDIRNAENTSEIAEIRENMRTDMQSIANRLGLTVQM